MKTHPIELRQKIIDAVDQQLGTNEEMAEMFGVTEQYIYKLLKQRRETGSLEPLPRGGGAQAKLSEEHLLLLAELIAQQPDATLAELRQPLRHATQMEASISTIWRGLEQLNFTQKKTKLAREADLVERAAFQRKQRQFKVWRLVFVDEFGINRAMSRIHARAPKGERARVIEPTERGNNFSVIQALRLAGVGATMLIEGAVDTPVWDEYVEHFLAPELQPGDIVMLDQISFHGSLRALGRIQAAKARVEKLPAYSPDFDPMEECIAKIKEVLRSSRARTEPGLLLALQRAIKTVTPEDIRGWFKHCGYTHLLK